MGQVFPRASSLQAASALRGLPHVSADVSQTASCSSKPTPTLSAILFCSCDRKGFLSLVHSMQSPFGLIPWSLFCKVEGSEFQFFLQGNEIILFWEKYCHPTCCWLQPGAVQQQFIWPWAVPLQDGHHPWQQMKPTLAMESCIPPFLLLSG